MRSDSHKSSDFLFYILLLVFVIINVFFKFALVSGLSMYPTLRDNDYLLVSCLKKPKSGDIVTILRDGSDKRLVKRVIGVSGDTVSFKDGNVYVNDSLLKEDYINKDEVPVYDNLSFTVSDDSYFVMGDNRNHSWDGRAFGEVKLSEVTGVVIFNLSHIGLSKLCIGVLVYILLFFISINYMCQVYKLNNLD